MSALDSPSAWAHPMGVLSRTTCNGCGAPLGLGHKCDGRDSNAPVKARFDLVPPEALDALTAVLTYGANKYTARNWEAGMDWGRPFAAAMRHLWAWWRGERDDAESGLSHLAHALCCIAFLIAYERRGTGTDDRVLRNGTGAA